MGESLGLSPFNLINKGMAHIKNIQSKRGYDNTDLYHHDGAIVRFEGSNLIRSEGKFSVGGSVCYTTPVRRECSTIERFELPYVVVHGGRVEISKLEGYERNSAYDDWAKRVTEDFNRRSYDNTKTNVHAHG